MDATDSTAPTRIRRPDPQLIRPSVQRPAGFRRASTPGTVPVAEIVARIRAERAS